MGNGAGIATELPAALSQWLHRACRQYCSARLLASQVFAKTNRSKSSTIAGRNRRWKNRGTFMSPKQQRHLATTFDDRQTDLRKVPITSQLSLSVVSHGQWTLV